MSARARRKKLAVLGFILPFLAAALVVVVGIRLGQETFTSAAAEVGDTSPSPSRVRPDAPKPLYGITVDDVDDVAEIVAAVQAAPRRLTTRIVFDKDVAPRDYVEAVSAIHPHSTIMGGLIDSDSLAAYTRAEASGRTAQYLSTLGSEVDIWEVGNEVNGNWTGDYADVSAKIGAAYEQVEAAGKQSALTLYYNVGCGNGPSELDPLEFSRAYVSDDMKQGLDYVFLSYYEGNCHDARPPVATWQAYFDQLRQLYPHAELGFGEVGLPDPVTSATLANAQAMLQYYYGLRITTPGYVGGYFWWYAYEDFLPVSANKPLWQTFTAAVSQY